MHMKPRRQTKGQKDISAPMSRKIETNHVLPTSIMNIRMQRYPKPEQRSPGQYKPFPLLLNLIANAIPRIHKYSICTASPWGLGHKGPAPLKRLLRNFRAVMKICMGMTFQLSERRANPHSPVVHKRHKIRTPFWDSMTAHMEVHSNVCKSLLPSAYLCWYQFSRSEGSERS